MNLFMNLVKRSFFSLNQPCLPNQQLISSGISQSLGRHMTSCHLRPVELVIQFAAKFTNRVLKKNQNRLKAIESGLSPDQGRGHVWVGGGNWTTPTQAMGGHSNSTYTLTLTCGIHVF